MRYAAYFIATLVACIAFALPGCKDRHDDHAGHDHGNNHAGHAEAPPVAAKGHDDHGHDHAGHDHGSHDDAKPATEKGHEGHDHSHDHGEHAEAAPAAAKGRDEHGHDHEDEAHADEVVLSPESIRRWGIRVEPLSKRVLAETVVVPARVSFNLEAVAHVGSVVSGRVGEIKVKIGDTVKANDPLMVVVSPELGQAQSEYVQRRSAIQTTETTLKVAKSLYDRAKALYDESQGIALSEVQKRESEYRAAEGEVIAARSAATAAENALHVLGVDQKAVEALASTGEIDPHFTVRAAIAGTVVAREVTLGEAVGPDRDALMVIADLSTLWVIADVPEPRLSGLAEGAKATVKLAALPGKEFDGVVTQIGMQMSEATRTIPVRIEVKGEARLRPGMFAQARIVAGVSHAEPAPAIPESAVHQVEGETSVFVRVEGEPNTFARRKVEVGPAVGNMLPLLSGLKEGESYVSKGGFMLKAELGKAGAAHEH